ncbi:hypothetical protein BB559_007121 [Furculomyces boomerangus]|uniref:Major facilitator superfamily (MFS) profile domain-containing protein n=2 Tax=Harpellales TaxID=61421 RepID=A0A2T9XYV8_9FUNG|nr:hypothetical protein BB559_007121 [Furculomyces boomerangus]PVZ97671.1 hypothetical protein BB558_006364 [Smittium angustum]PWA01347.1 hypothetical protein BB558_002546 [Smittium angustum]
MTDKFAEEMYLQGDEEYPDTTRAWLMCICSFVCMAMSMGVNNSFVVYQVVYSTKVFPKEDPYYISWIGAIALGFTLLSGIFAARLTNILGFRTVVWAGALFSFMSLIVSSSVTSVSGLILSQGALLGLSSGLIYSSAISVTSIWFEKNRGVAIGVVISGSGVGGIFFSWIVNVISTKHDYILAQKVTGFIILIVVCIAAIPLRSRIELKKEPMLFRISVFKNPIFLVTMIGGFIGYLGYAMPLFYLPTSTVSFGTPKDQSVSIATIINVGTIIGGLMLGQLADSLGPMNILAYSTLMLGVLVTLFWMFYKQVAGMISIAFLYGFFSSGFISVSFSVLGRYFEANKIHIINGMYLFFMSISALVSNGIFGKLSGNSTDKKDFFETVLFSVIVYFTASLVLIGGVFVIRKKLSDKTWIH